jgi:hypothetical protein
MNQGSPPLKTCSILSKIPGPPLSIFDDDQDRKVFVEKLAGYIDADTCHIYAFALMDNHGHILFRSGAKGVSSVMRKHVIEEECRERQVSTVKSTSGGRRHTTSQARSAIVYRSATELGLSSAEIARHHFRKWYQQHSRHHFFTVSVAPAFINAMPDFRLRSRGLALSRKPGTGGMQRIQSFPYGEIYPIEVDIGA